MASITPLEMQEQVRKSVGILIQQLSCAPGDRKGQEQRLKAVIALRDLTAASPCSRKEVVAAGGTQLLVNILKARSSAQMLLQAATATLQHLALQPEVCSQLGELVIEPLLSLLVQPGTRPCVLAPVLNTLKSLCTTDINRAETLQQLGGIQHLVQFATNYCSSTAEGGQPEDQGTLVCAMSLLRALATLSDSVGILSSGHVSAALLQLLSCSTHVVVETVLLISLRTVSRVSADSAFPSKLVKAGAIPALLKVITCDSTGAQLQQYALQKLLMLLQRLPATQLVLYKAGGATAIVQLLATCSAAPDVGSEPRVHACLEILKLPLCQPVISQAVAAECIAARAVAALIHVQATLGAADKIINYAKGIVLMLVKASDGAAIADLVAHLHSFESSGINGQACRQLESTLMALKDSVSHSPGFLHRAVTSGLPAALLAVLSCSHSSDDTRCLAVVLIGDVAALQPDACLELQKQGTLQALQQMIQEDAKRNQYTQLTSSAVRALSLICRNANDGGAASEASQTLLVLLASKEHIAQREAATALGELGKHHEVCAQAVYNACVPTLVQLLTGNRSMSSCCFASSVMVAFSSFVSYPGTRGSFSAILATLDFKRLLPTARHCSANGSPYLCTHCCLLLEAVTLIAGCLVSEPTGPGVLLTSGIIAALIDAVQSLDGSEDVGLISKTTAVLVKLAERDSSAAALLTAQGIVGDSKLGLSPAAANPIRELPTLAAGQEPQATGTAASDCKSFKQPPDGIAATAMDQMSSSGVTSCTFPFKPLGAEWVAPVPEIAVLEAVTVSPATTSDITAVVALEAPCDTKQDKKKKKKEKKNTKKKSSDVVCLQPHGMSSKACLVAPKMPIDLASPKASGAAPASAAAAASETEAAPVAKATGHVSSPPVSVPANAQLRGLRADGESSPADSKTPSSSDDDAKTYAPSHLCGHNMFAVLNEPSPVTGRARQAASSSHHLSTLDHCSDSASQANTAACTGDAAAGWLPVSRRSSRMRRQPTSARPLHLPVALHHSSDVALGATHEVNMQNSAGLRDLTEVQDAVKRFVAEGAIQEVLLDGLDPARGHLQLLLGLQGELEAVLDRLLSGVLADGQAAAEGVIELQAFVNRALNQAENEQHLVYPANTSAAGAAIEGSSSAFQPSYTGPASAASSLIAGATRQGSGALARKPLPAAPAAMRQVGHHVGAVTPGHQMQGSRLKWENDDVAAPSRQAMNSAPAAAAAETACWSGTGTGRKAGQSTTQSLQQQSTTVSTVEAINDDTESMLHAAAPANAPHSRSERALQASDASASRRKALIPECVVCMDAPPSVVFFPCKHLAACVECAKKYGPGGGLKPDCPVCSAFISQQVCVYINCAE